MVIRHLTLQTDPRYRSRDGVDDARAASGSMKGSAKMVLGAFATISGLPSGRSRCSDKASAAPTRGEKS
jgi:hypothetical protein